MENPSSFDEKTVNNSVDSSVHINDDPTWSFDIPLGYGDNKAVLMVRDPWTIYAYWELREDVENSVRQDIENKGLQPSKMILRVYNMSSGEPQAAFDFELTGWVSNWYIHTADPGNSWMVELGVLTTTGEFFTIARSNVVQTPRHAMSDIYDEDWMCPEDLYYKMFSASGGSEVGKSSMEMRELVERFLRKWLSSGGISSFLSSGARLFRRDK